MKRNVEGGREDRITYFSRGLLSALDFVRISVDGVELPTNESQRKCEASVGWTLEDELTFLHHPWRCRNVRLRTQRRAQEIW